MTAHIIHKVREHEYLDGDPPIFSCVCGFTGPRPDVDRHVTDSMDDAPLLPHQREQLIADLSHELKLAAINWSKADELADDAGARLDQRSVDVKRGAAELDERDPKFNALVQQRTQADVELTWASQREDQALERLKAIAKKLTRALEKT